MLVGGPTAEAYDYRESATRDNFVILPLALVVVLVILAILLRALLAPVLLVASVILSFFAALGTGIFFFEHVFGFPGIDPSLPLLAFVFLVALGIDYNIFLMARVREETLRYGTRTGMLRGLAVTGAVITSAGIVLAGTFSALAVLPLVFLHGDRLHHRLRRAARHVPRALGGRAGARIRHRSAHLVAVAARARGRRGRGRGAGRRARRAGHERPGLSPADGWTLERGRPPRYNIVMRGGMPRRFACLAANAGGACWRARRRRMRPAAADHRRQPGQPGRVPGAGLPRAPRQRRFICGGTLISNRHFLTAAHCATQPETTTPLAPGAFTVTLGKVDTTTFRRRRVHDVVANRGARRVRADRPTTTAPQRRRAARRSRRRAGGLEPLAL